jgi:hypothetical protein
MAAIMEKADFGDRRRLWARAARLVHKVGDSLRDVQVLAGHQSLLTTQRNIDGTPRFSGGSWP